MPSSHSALNLPQSGTFHLSSDSSVHIRWPKYWSLSISPFNKYSGLISFRIDWFDVLSVQGTLRSFLQSHSLKASILWCSAFFMVQLSQPYGTTGKTIALTIWTLCPDYMTICRLCRQSNVSAFQHKIKSLKLKKKKIRGLLLSPKRTIMETSLVVQWLRLCLPVQRVWVWPLTGEIRSHMPPGQKKPKHKTEATL